MLVNLLLLCIAVVIFTKSPVKAVLAMAALLPVWIEWKIPELFGISVGLVDAVVIGGLLGTIFFVPKNPRDRNGFSKFLVCAYMIICAVSSLSNPNLKIDDVSKLIWVPYKAVYVSLTFFLFYSIVKNKQIIQKAVNLVILSSALTSLLGIIQVIKQSPISIPIGLYANELSKIGSSLQGGDSLRAFGTLWHPNDLGGFLIWPLSISLTLLLFDKGYKYRRYLPILILIQGVALLLTFSRGGWMGFLVSFLIIGSCSKIWRHKHYLVIPLVLIVAIVAIKGVFPRSKIFPGGNVRERVFSLFSAREDPAMLARYERWDYFLEMSLERPLIGFGTLVSKSTREYFEDAAPTPHNTFLFLAVKRGYVALGIIVMIILRIGVIAKRVYKSAEDTFIKALGLGAFAGLIGLFGVSSFFDSHFEDTQINVLFWLILAITLRLKDINSSSKLTKSRLFGDQKKKLGEILTE